MSGIEIALLITGGVIFVVSFFLPDSKGKKEASSGTAGMTEDQVKYMVEKEIDDARQHIGEIVDETISYAMEKSERSMDRITNEKMLAINEYSDNVLGEINKNHQEAVFLYDMLNDKHETLKSTVSKAAITASEVKQAVQDAEVTAKEAEAAVKLAIAQLKKEETVKREMINELPQAGVQRTGLQRIGLPPEEFHRAQSLQTEVQQAQQRQVGGRQTEFRTAEFQPMNPFQLETILLEGDQIKSTRKPIDPPVRAITLEPAVENMEVGNREMNIHFKGNGSNGRNNNERILELHKAGKSNMAIAKELGLGLGEVKLVIDLFEGAN